MLLKLLLAATAALDTGSREKPAPEPILLNGYKELLAPDMVSDFDLGDDKFIEGDSAFLGFLFRGSSLSFSKWPRSGETLPPTLSDPLIPLELFIKL